MTSVLARWCAFFLMAAGLLAPAVAGGNQQQASFAVIVTLHTVVKPLPAAELCRNPGTIRVPGATVQVDCPKPTASAPPAGADAPVGAPERADRPLPPEVTVVF